MTLVEFMHSENYNKYLDKLDDSLLLMKIDRAEEPHKIVIELQSRWLTFAGITSDDLLALITNYEENTIKYIVQMQVAFTEPDGGVDNIVNYPPQIDFPIGYLIEFFILLKKTKELMEYLKVIRMPGPKQYANEIKNIFNESMQ